MVKNDIRDRRERRGLSVRSLAREANIAPGSLSQIERGIRNPTNDEIERIEGALGENVRFWLPIRRVD